MAITFDNSSTGTATALTCTVAHTTAGSNRLLVVSTLVDGGKTITGVTYNGIAMTQFGGELIFSGGHAINGWYIINPASGSNNIVATANSGTPNIYVRGVSYTSVVQTSSLDVANGGGTDSGSSMVATATTVFHNDIMISAFAVTSANTITASTNTTARVGSGTLFMMGDYQTIGSGAQSMTATINAGAAHRWVTATFKSFPESGGILFFT